MDLDGEMSEHEESAPVSAQPLGEVDPRPGSEDPVPADGESDNELDLLVEAETESDSDDNHSNQDAASAQRSVQTGATAGSDGGVNSILMYPEDESGESSQQEDDESEAGETDEQDAEDFQLREEQLERRRLVFLSRYFLMDSILFFVLCIIYILRLFSAVPLVTSNATTWPQYPCNGPFATENLIHGLQAA